MTSTQPFRASGLALAAGAIAFIVHLVARSVITAGLDQVSVAQHALWVPISALGALGAALVLLGLPAITTNTAGSTGWPTLAGAALIALAWLFLGVFLSLYSLLVAPWLAEQAPALVAAGAPLPAGIITMFVLALAAELVGSVLFALPFIRGQVQPRWVGYTLLAAALLRAVGNLIAPAGPASNLAINLLSNLGPMLLVATLGYLGLRIQPGDASAGRASEMSERALRSQ